MQNSGPWDPWLLVVENSRLCAKRGHSAGTAHGAPPVIPIGPKINAPFAWLWHSLELFSDNGDKPTVLKQPQMDRRQGPSRNELMYRTRKVMMQHDDRRRTVPSAFARSECPECSSIELPYKLLTVKQIYITPQIHPAICPGPFPLAYGPALGTGCEFGGGCTLWGTGGVCRLWAVQQSL